MNNPWQIDDAFNDFFTDTVELDAVRDGVTYAAPFEACLFPIEDVDPFIDSDTTNETKRMSVILRIEDVDNSLKIRPEIQDTIKMIDDSIWGICEVTVEQNWYKIIVRSKR